MTRLWFHCWCENCGRDEYFASDEHECGLDACSCGENILAGGYHLKCLGQGTMRFEKER